MSRTLTGLDEVVMNEAEDLASRVSADGPEAQLLFLKKYCDWSDDTLEALLLRLGFELIEGSIQTTSLNRPGAAVTATFRVRNVGKKIYVRSEESAP